MSEELRECRTCKTAKLCADFNKRENGRLNTQCKLCQSDYSKAHYRRNKDKALKRRYLNTKRYKVLLKAAVRAYKLGRSCMDCGEIHPPWAMEFDHRDRSTKLFNIADHAGRGKSASTVKLFAEIAKCDLVCTLCHRYRTHDMRRTKYVPEFIA